MSRGILRLPVGTDWGIVRGGGCILSLPAYRCLHESVQVVAVDERKPVQLNWPKALVIPTAKKLSEL